MSDLGSYLKKEPRLVKRRQMDRVAWVVTVLVLGLVVLMRGPYKIPLPEGVDLMFLPAVHAGLNTVCAVFLLAGLWFILKGRVRAHRNCMTGALVVSVAFLLCYVAYHFTTEETRYGGEGVVKTVYLVLLATHILTAAVSFPLILFTFIAAWTSDFGRHRRLVKWTFPMWLYVAVTGPLCYWMLRPFY